MFLFYEWFPERQRIFTNLFELLRYFAQLTYNSNNKLFALFIDADQERVVHD